MPDFSLSQKFFLCAVNANGYISNLQSSTWTCLILSTLIDLEQHGCLAIDKPDIVIAQPLPEHLGYLVPVVNRIKEQSPISMEHFVGNYVTGLTETARQELFESIGDSLVAAEAANTINSPIPMPRMGFIPHQQHRNSIIEAIRAAFFPPTPETGQIILASLLHHGKLTKNYFSRSEQKNLKETLAKYHHYSAQPHLIATLRHIDSVMNVPVIVSLIASTGN